MWPYSMRMACTRNVWLAVLWMWHGMPEAAGAGFGTGESLRDEFGRSRKVVISLGVGAAIVAGIGAVWVSGAVFEALLGRHSTWLDVETPGGRCLYLVRGVLALVLALGASVSPSIVLVRMALRRHPGIQLAVDDNAERMGTDGPIGSAHRALPLMTNLVLAAALAVPSALLVALAVITGWRWFNAYALGWGVLAVMILGSLNFGRRVMLILAPALACAFAVVWIATGVDEYLGMLGVLGVCGISSVARGHEKQVASLDRTS